MSAATDGPDPSTFWQLPVKTAAGVAPPPMPIEVGVMVTLPDAAGNRWAVLRLADGTTSVEFRVPHQVAPGLGQAVMQALTDAAAQITAQPMASKLVLPDQATGRLVVPRPVPNGGSRG